MAKMTEEERRKRIEAAALDVMNLSRTTITLKKRFMDAAVGRLELHSHKDGTITTDGQYLVYDPEYVLRQYQIQPEICSRNFLHAVLHCVMLHMFVSPAVDRELWGLACDIAVENMISDLGVKEFKAAREDAQDPYLSKLSGKLDGFFNAERIYDFLIHNRPSEEALVELRSIFYCDNHDIWYMSEDEKCEAYGVGQPASDTQQDSDSQSSSDSQQDSDSQQSAAKTRQQLASEWSDISRHMQEEIQNFTNQPGNSPGSLVSNLKSVNRERYDYTSFLKQFAVIGEEMQINQDEFDYVYYTYGLELYDEMPLIEPLEYKDVKKIKEFVIAVDTSGSTASLVQAFLQKTYNVLISTDSYFKKTNIHIIQCDAEIQEDYIITCAEDLEKYIANLHVRGFGGTDFRPVFEYVDKLIEEKHFTNLKGLIYFTDACGPFPVKVPKYKTAVVFVDSAFNDFGNVPPWAIKLVLQKSELESGEF